ncbi:hypothetical protein [Kitasatospora sp. NPDC004531]
MPGQRKRKRQQQELAREHAARYYAQGAGSWQVLLSSGDHAELKAYVNELSAAEPDLRSDDLRIDMFCGRDEHPTRYRLSRFVPNPGPDRTPAEG